MKAFLHRIFPDVFFENPTYFRAFVLGLVYLTLLIMQLFTFEDLPELASNFPLKLGAGGGLAFAVTVTLLEAIALPALLAMKISKLFWTASRTAVILVPFVWLAHGLALNLMGYRDSTGLFGATLEVANGWWFIMFMALTTLTAIVIAWELPFRGKERKKK